MNHTKAQRKAIAEYSVKHGCCATVLDKGISKLDLTKCRQEFGIAKNRAQAPDPQFKIDVVRSYRKIGRAATLLIPRFSHLNPTTINTWDRELGELDDDCQFDPDKAHLPKTINLLGAISNYTWLPDAARMVAV